MRPGPLRVGQDFGPRYHVTKLLGSGGMGVVYQAFDVELNEDVALKVLRAPARQASASASVAEMQRRFRAELVLARKVTHKHVIRIHDIGEIDGIKFISMPLIKGRDLATILEDGPLSAERALRYARQIVAGLTAVHAAKIVHRDMKPSNVMIDQQDQVILMDFGIARSNAPGAAQRTLAGAVVGTTAYMAPEQARAEAVDERTDVYGCGLVLYEMLSGPRTNLTLSELMSRMKTPPTSARQMNPTVSAELDAIVTKCLQPAQSDRYQTSAALAEALDGLDRKRKRGFAMPLTMTPWMKRAAGTAALVAAMAAFAAWITSSHGAKSLRAGQAIAARATNRLEALNPVTLFARERESDAPDVASAAAPVSTTPRPRAARESQPVDEQPAIRAREPERSAPRPEWGARERLTLEHLTPADAPIERPSVRLATAERRLASPPAMYRPVESMYQSFDVRPRLPRPVEPSRPSDPVVLTAARTIALARPLAPRRQDRDVWILARSLALSGAPSSPGNGSTSRLLAADLAIARGDYEGAAGVLIVDGDGGGNWLDRVLLGTAYSRSDSLADAFEEFQVCHLPPAGAEPPVRQGP